MKDGRLRTAVGWLRDTFWPGARDKAAPAPSSTRPPSPSSAHSLPVDVVLLILEHVTAAQPQPLAYRTLLACTLVSRRLRELVPPFLYRINWSHHLRFELYPDGRNGELASSFTPRDLRRLAGVPTKSVPHWLPFFPPRHVCTHTIASVELVFLESYSEWSDFDDQSRRAWENFLQKQTQPFKLVVPWMPTDPPENSWDIFRTSSRSITNLVTHHLNCPAWFRLAGLSNLSSLTVTTSFLLSACDQLPQPLLHLTHLQIECRALTDQIPPFLQFTPNLISLTFLHPTSFGSTATSLCLSLTPALSSLSILLGSLPPSTAEARNAWMQQHLDDLFPLFLYSLPTPGAPFFRLAVSLVPSAGEDVDRWRCALAASTVKDRMARDPTMARVKSLAVVEAEGAE